MANNFRLTGNYYISKAGHDSNDGLTPDTAKKSIPTGNLSSFDIIIGSGVYQFPSGASLTAKSVEGDGLVVIDLQQGSSQSIIPATSSGYLRNLRLINSDSVSLSTAVGIHSKLSLENIVIPTTTRSDDFQGNILINVQHLSGGNKIATSGVGSILINSQVNFKQIYNTYVDVNSYVVGNFTGVFGNNNIQGVIQLEAIFYAIQDQFTGTPQDNGYTVGVEWLNEANLTANGYTGTISGWDAAVATCINRDPLFNDASKLDFTLQANSPHIGRAFDGVSNIGGTEYSQSYYAGIGNPNILLLEGDSNIDSTTNINDWVLESLSTQGKIRVIVKISDTDEEIGAVNYIGNLSFDSDVTGGDSSNFNVPDSKPVSNEYPTYDQTTGDAINTTSVVIAGHSYVAGQWLKVEGQYREIDSTDSNTLFFLTAVRAIVLSGTDIQVGSFSGLAALNPNRLNMRMRTSKLADVNVGNWDDNATWDNDSVATAGTYLAQEWNNQPMIDNLNGVGFGDDQYNAAFGNPIQAKYIDMEIYLRDDYKS